MNLIGRRRPGIESVIGERIVIVTILALARANRAAARHAS
jgi:hypothetical protein